MTPQGDGDSSYGTKSRQSRCISAMRYGGSHACFPHSTNKHQPSLTNWEFDTRISALELLRRRRMLIFVRFCAMSESCVKPLSTQTCSLGRNHCALVLNSDGDIHPWSNM